MDESIEQKNTEKSCTNRKREKKIYAHSKRRTATKKNNTV